MLVIVEWLCTSVSSKIHDKSITILFKTFQNITLKSSRLLQNITLNTSNFFKLSHSQLEFVISIHATWKIKQLRSLSNPFVADWKGGHGLNTDAEWSESEILDCFDHLWLWWLYVDSDVLMCKTARCGVGWKKSVLSEQLLKFTSFSTFVTSVDSLNFLHSDEKDRKWWYIKTNFN